MTEVRLVSYNVRSLRDDRAAVARVVAALAPDVLCLQEMPRFLCWRVKRGRLARACGMRIAVSRRPAGLAVFTGRRARVLHGEYHLLSRIPGLHRRGLAIAVLEFDPGRDARNGEKGPARLIVASVHLDLISSARERHTREILARLARVRERYPGPIVVAGDINEQPGEPSWKLLSDRFQDGHDVVPEGEAPTFTSRAPAKRIDGVFADRGVTVLGCGVPADPEIAADYPAATDHRPVKADLRLPTEA